MLTVILTLPKACPRLDPSRYFNAHIRTQAIRGCEEGMSSSSRPRGSRYRFGFRGKPPGRNPQAATTDEILDSLTRQAKLMERDGKERTLGLQTIAGIEPDEELPQSPGLESGSTFERFKNRNLGMSIFAAMLIGGLVFLWIYSRLAQTLNMKSFATVQQTISNAGFADWQKIAMIALFALIIALLTRRSRNRARSRLF